MLGTGQALWRVGSRSFVVAHQRSAIEAELTDTDSGMDAGQSIGAVPRRTGGRR